MSNLCFSSSLSGFKSRFYNKLAAMLDADELGAFILVLANSLQDKYLQNLLSEPLRNRFIELKLQYEQQDLDAAKDDLSVFEALLAYGFDNLGIWEYAQLDQWVLAFNPMRMLRPARSSAEKVVSLQKPFDTTSFNFNKPFLLPELFWEGDLNDVAVRVFYNKFPFAPYHLLIVPDYEQCLPQYLSPHYHQYMWNLTTKYCEALDGFGIAFNSLGAYASINQFHFQGFIQQQLLPIEDNCWTHNGGQEIYPLSCQKFSGYESAWKLIETLHTRKTAYNLLYRKGECYVITRKFQGDETQVDWTQGLAWSEVCGVQTLGDRQLFTTLNAESVRSILSSAKSDS